MELATLPSKRGGPSLPPPAPSRLLSPLVVYTTKLEGGRESLKMAAESQSRRLTPSLASVVLLLLVLLLRENNRAALETALGLVLLVLEEVVKEDHETDAVAAVAIDFQEV